MNILSHKNHTEHTQNKVDCAHRISTPRLAMTWSGFPFILAITMTGSVLALGAGFEKAATATVLGSLFMFFYVGILGEWGWRSGQSFAQIAQSVFGHKGFRLISGLLATLVLGWFAINTAMPAEILAATYGLPYPVIAIILGALFLMITARGINGVNAISLLSVPAYLALLVFATMEIWRLPLGSALPSHLAHPLGFSAALSATIASFADSVALWRLILIAGPALAKHPGSEQRPPFPWDSA